MIKTDYILAIPLFLWDLLVPVVRVETKQRLLLRRGEAQVCDFPVRVANGIDRLRESHQHEA